MEAYRPVLALHVVAIISWMAGILYLYRLLVYATENGTRNAEIHALLSTMSRRLYRYITVPAMAVSWAAGLTMIALAPGLLSQGWLHVKLASVVALSIATLYAGRLTRRYQDGQAPLPSSRHLRFLNEVPTLLMILIVIMVILKPF